MKNPVHLVCYYRYFRFFPDGTLLYRTTPEVPSMVERSLRTVGRSGLADGVSRGRYLLKVHARPIPALIWWLICCKHHKRS